VEQALARAGQNRAELTKALNATPVDHRKGMAFLIANMPERDLTTLRADFLLENVDLAYKARKQVPWGAQIPEDVFLDNVLAYANVDESRDPWRKELYDLCMPLIKECKTPSEAAEMLNRKVFPQLKVKYSTGRKKPHQSPKESIETGMASCTGLSILLSDACRSVCVPARLVGTPLWTNKTGNHTWVEIWDRDWHFTGACEPDPNGLNRGWFVGNASQAKKDVPEHAIYAATFRKSALSFPLVWAPQRKDVYAENVTDRYTRTAGVKPGLRDQECEQVEKNALAFFSAPPDEQARWRFDSRLGELLAAHEDAVRAAVWKAYQAAPVHAALKTDYEQNQVRYDKYLSPYKKRDVGKRPGKGWPLVIAMHGGGGVKKEVNDSQWKTMEMYYKDHPEVGGYKYVALRAPNDIWNGFYDDYVPPLVTNLIRQFTIFGDVDPDKVYLIGYSHGGYGAFFIGPKIPDRFAAVHASAAAPTDGTISPLSLRNTRFTFMIGEHDNAYDRRERCEKFDKDIQKLKEANQGDFPVEMEFMKDRQHSNLPDRDKLKEVLGHARNVVPRRLTWELTDKFITDFFWLKVPQPTKAQSIDAALSDNVLTITTRNVKEFAVSLDRRLIAYDTPLRVMLNGVSEEVKVQPSLRTLCDTMLERGDPQLAFTCRLRLGGETK
jgi:predicted esterase